MTFSWSLPAPTLHNGVITGYSLSRIPVASGRSSVFMQYTTAGTFTLGGFTPAISYNCSISASNIWGSGPAAYSMVLTLDDCKYLSWMMMINLLQTVVVFNIMYSCLMIVYLLCNKCLQHCCSSYS